MTAINGAVITCSRGNEGTSPAAWSAGDLCFGALTAGELENIIPSTYVQTFNGRSGAVTLSATDVNGALGYTAANAADVVNTFNGRLGAVNLSSSDVTTALGYTPVETVAIASANGVSGSVAVSGATQTATLTLGAITPSSISCSGAASAASISTTGAATVLGGLSLGSAVGSSPTDLSHGLALNSTTYGLNVTAGQVNLVAGGAAVWSFAATGATTFPGTLTATTANFSGSDRRLKRNIRKAKPRPLHRAIPYVEFDRKNDGSHGRGAIAQRVQKFASEYVGTFMVGKKQRLSLDYASLAYEQAVWASQELDKALSRIKKLEARLAALERRV